MNLWIMTEEYPKTSTIEVILREVAEIKGWQPPLPATIQIRPVMSRGKFQFCYAVVGCTMPGVTGTFIRTVSGSSSFIDYLVFLKEDEPTLEACPLIALEETKVDIDESRNVTAYQRNTKFVHLHYVYPALSALIMYYRDFPCDSLNETYSLKFGFRLLLTMGVKIAGISNLDEYDLEPFESVDDLIRFKAAMPPPASGQRVEIIKHDSVIEISIKLDKGNGEAQHRISHDPNVGQAASIIRCLRSLGWEGAIVLKNHHVTQRHFSGYSGKLLPALLLDRASLDGLRMPTRPGAAQPYWRMNPDSEKVGTIFLHAAVEGSESADVIFDNHAGGERGYLVLSTGETQAVPKTLRIPDLVILDRMQNQIVSIEGKTARNVASGISALEDLAEFEDSYLRRSYPGYTLERCVALFGGDAESVAEPEVAFILNEEGLPVVSPSAPEVIKRAIQRALAT